MNQSEASIERDRLSAFVGIWETEGELMDNPAADRVKFKGTDTYEWLPGHYFLFHRFEAKMPEGNLIRVEIIGYDQENATYFMHSFDSLGNANVMEGRFEEDNWTFVGKSSLFTGGFRDDGREFAGLWERRSGDGSWQPWMEVTLKKVV